MKTLDIKTFLKLNLLLIPMGIVVAIMILDNKLSLGLNSSEWGLTAIFATFSIFFIGSTVALIKNKCWELLVYEWLVYIFLFCVIFIF